MKLLIVDDSDETVSVLTRKVQEFAPAAEFTVVSNQHDALAAIESSDFDFAIIDLEIPFDSSKAAISKDLGTEVAKYLIERSPGTPIIYHSGYALESLPAMKNAIRDSVPRKLFGTDDLFPMLDLIDKSQLAQCIQQIKLFFEGLQGLANAVEIMLSNGLTLEPMDIRLLRSCARRQGGNQVHIAPTSGGLSSAKTLRLRICNSGAPVVSIIAKLDQHLSVADERNRYRTSVTRLGIGCLTHVVEMDELAAGKRSGIFYKLADGYDHDLFHCLEGNPQIAADLVAKVRYIEDGWLQGKSIKNVRIVDLRESLISEKVVQERIGTIDGFDRQEFEARNVSVSMSTQHRDLHGLNILVNGNNEPVFIDYGMAGVAPTCLDPLILETSLIFHPAGRAICNGWPAPDDARNWHDLDIYVANCPYPAFIRSCREWAYAERNTAGVRGILATAYAYILRQLKFADTDKEVAHALLLSITTAWQQT